MLATGLWCRVARGAFLFDKHAVFIINLDKLPFATRSIYHTANLGGGRSPSLGIPSWAPFAVANLLPGKKMAKKRILVVDDEDYHRNLVRAFVEKLGYSVTDCASPSEALALLKNESFPLIITDLIMYDMDGMEFCEKIRETDKKSKVLALSGFIDLYESEKLDRAGFDGFLDKPIEMQKLKNAILEALGEK